MIGQWLVDWGPETLLAAVLIFMVDRFGRGKILPESIHDKIVDKLEAVNQKEVERNAELKLYYENRISDINAAHLERGADLRHVAETNARALQTAVDNTQKLVGIVDELTEIARVAAPAILAARQAAEAANESST